MQCRTWYEKNSFISRYALFLSFSIMFVACESDQAKIQRLDADRTTYCILSEKYSR